MLCLWHKDWKMMAKEKKEKLRTFKTVAEAQRFVETCKRLKRKYVL